MSNKAEIFQTMFLYKAWANAEMFAQLKKYVFENPEHAKELHAAVRTLNHVYVVDKIFQANLQGLPHGYRALNTPETPLLEDLHTGVCDLDQWFLHYVAQLTSDQINQEVAFTFASGSPGLMTRGDMLLHVVTHGVYHRGAVGQILSSRDLEPPVDGLTAFRTHHKNEARPAFIAPSQPPGQLHVI